MRPSLVLLSTVGALALAACSTNSQQASRSDTSGAGANASASTESTTQGPSGLRMYLPHSGITSRHVADQFSFNDVATESRGKPVPLVVLGDPLGADRQALGQAIAQDLHGSNWAGPGITFVPTTGAALSQSRAIDDRSISPYSLVMMVNGPNEITAQNLCSNPAIDSRVATAPSATASPRSGSTGASGAAPQSGAAAGASGASAAPVTVISALCRYDKEVSDVSGRTSVTGVTDPAFRGLVNATLAEMAGPQSTNANDTLEGDK